MFLFTCFGENSVLDKDLLSIFDSSFVLSVEILYNGSQRGFMKNLVSQEIEQKIRPCESFASSALILRHEVYVGK